VSAPNVALMTMATGRYVELLDGLVESARRHFFAGAPRRIFVFTDAEGDAPPFASGEVIPLAIEHEPWPMVTLKRFHYFTRYREALLEADYLFYIDVDMRFVADCGEEILPSGGSGLVAVRHPAFYRGHRGIASHALDALTGGRWSARPLPHRKLPFERNPQSRACVDDADHCVYYYGAFNGGESRAFLAMAERLRDAVEDDLARGIVAVWHDESHLNRYLCEHAPKSLTPAYAFPQSGYPHLSHLKPVIVALDKDHAYFRQAG
jgi:hypothetical protein